MPTHVALLRGINVGGRNKVAMADLREVVSSLGHTDVATYIQSGNVLLSTGETDTKALAAALERAIEEKLAVRPRVVVLSRAELAQVARDTPYRGEPNPKNVHAVFLGDEPGPDALEGLAAALDRVAAAGSRDTARVVGRTLFLHTPDGFGRSELAALLIGGKGGAKAIGAKGTARNWATVTKLLALCEA
jgi:uncharacterized protein (DUF1697 family)